MTTTETPNVTASQTTVQAGIVKTSFDISASTPPGLANIKQLDGTNYNEWADRMQDILKSQGLWIILTNDAFETNPVKAQWLKDKTFGTIKLAINRKAVTIPTTITQPNELWDYLKSKYMPKDTMKCITLVRKFHSLIMLDTETLPAFIHRVENLAAELEEVGEPLTDKMLAWTLLAGLLPKYDSLVMGFAASHAKDTITSDSVKRSFYFEDSRTMPNEYNNKFYMQSSNAALYSSRTQARDICETCGGSGHHFSVCPTPPGHSNSRDKTPFQPGQRGRGKGRGRRRRTKSRDRNQNSGNKGSNVNYSMKNNDVNLSTSSTGAHLAVLTSFPQRTPDDANTRMSSLINKDTILVDSGASATLVADSSWLHDWQETKKIQVASASSDSNLVTNATGKLILKSKYGNLSIYPTTHVIGLRVNLLSVSQLTDADCKVIYDKQICQIWHKPTHKLIGSAIKNNGLYVLQASPKKQSTSVFNVGDVEADNENQIKHFSNEFDNTKIALWH